MTKQQANIIQQLKKGKNLRAFLTTFFIVEEITELMKERVAENTDAAMYAIEERLGFEGWNPTELSDNPDYAPAMNRANYCNDILTDVYCELVPVDKRFKGWNTWI